MNDTVQLIKDKACILEVIGSVVELKKVGNKYIGLCPFHNEKTPSFNIEPEKGYYHCFGCGASGDVIKFVQEHNGLSFKDALEHLANRYVVQIQPLSERHPATANNPNAPADAYLSEVRGFDLKKIQNLYQVAFIKHSSRDEYAPVVEFTLTNGSKWGRLIDDKKVKSFSKKAHFKGTYKHEGWVPDSINIDADRRIFICEGIFKSIAFGHIGLNSISGMSSGNLPINIINEYAKKDVQWILAYDNDKAGITAALKHGSILKDMGIPFQVAFPESKKMDWDDLYKAGKFNLKYIEDSLWRGCFYLAKTGPEKAFWHWAKFRKSYHLFDFGRCLWVYSHEKSGEQDSDETKPWLTAQEDLQVRIAEFISDSRISRISNCHPELLYMENNRLSGEQSFFFKITYENQNPERRINLDGSALKSASAFNEALLKRGYGGDFNGDFKDILKLRHKYLGYEFRGKIVDTITFIGYDRSSKAYIYPGFAYANDKYIKANSNDSLQIGEAQLKTNQPIPITDNHNFDGSWLPKFYKAHSKLSIPILGWWLGCLFAEQFRHECELKFYPFLEVVGEGSAGKSSIIKFLWKCLGRDNYEGFNPSKASEIGWMREIQQVSNLPVTMLEAFSDGEDPKKGAFKKDDLKPLLDGVCPRITGKKTNDNSTQANPFRGAVAMIHNPVDSNGDEATISRYVQIILSCNHHSKETEKCFLELNKLGVEDLSGFLHTVLTNGSKIFDSIIKSYFEIKERFDSKIQMKQRVSSCHALVAACCQNLDLVFGKYMTEEMKRESEEIIWDCALKRQALVVGDCPQIAEFWDFYEHINSKTIEKYGQGKLNHSKDPELIAIKLTEFIEQCNYYNLKRFSLSELKRLLKGSRTRKFVDSSRVIKSKNSDLTIRCWIFEKPKKSAKT